MQHLSEYRDIKLVHALLGQINDEVTKPWKIMEICGGQTHSLVKNGILDMLPKAITMVHGPGCPVCVTPVSIIDQAIELALNHDAILCSFGDMLRVPGSSMTLLTAKSLGGDIRIMYSPLEAVEVAKKHPQREVVFLAVGFETTAPANALSVILAQKEKIRNYFLLTSHVLVPPAMEAILSDPDNQIDAFLAAGHVCTVMGYEQYHFIADKYQIPIIITGFEPVDLLKGILAAVSQLEKGSYEVENEYSRAVSSEGNLRAIENIQKVFKISDWEWRGIGTIPNSGYALNERFLPYDARTKFKLSLNADEEENGCIAGLVLKGLKKPYECPKFGKSCNPTRPGGAPMVSSEGACAAYYQFTQSTPKQDVKTI